MAETESNAGVNGALPDDGDAAKMLSFGEQLRAARPALSGPALARVHAAMRRELDLRTETRRPTRWPVAAAMAALVVIGLLVAWYVFTLTPRPAQVARKARPWEIIEKSELDARRSALAARYDAAKTPAARAALAAEYARITPDEQLSTEVRYDAAMGLLLNQLHWHAADTQLSNRLDRMESIQSERDEKSYEAHAGEKWMHSNIPSSVEHDLKAHRSKMVTAAEKLKRNDDPSFYWTLDNPVHADVTRAVALLGSVHSDAATRWVEALRCNNTVLTMDVRGGYALGSSAPIRLDMRAAEQITFKLYRVTDPQKMQAVVQRVGTDYIFTDLLEEEKLAMALRDMQKIIRMDPPRLGELPDFSTLELAGTWQRAVADLKSSGLSKHHYEDDEWEDEEEQEPDADYFGDSCPRFHERLQREYWPEEGELSSWQCGREFEVPGSALKQPGGYVLVAEANGVKACAPILVEPLSVALHRCRDGVLVVASDTDGNAPLPGAQVLAEGMLQARATDANGVAFVPVFAAGDKPFLVYKGERFAIGGFGKIFDGIYQPVMERQRWLREFRDKRMAAADQGVGQVFEDRHVVAAYTDRPTYRPGQDVQFKLIVRLLGEPNTVAPGTSTGFRDEDFEPSKFLQLPNAGTSVQFEALDKKGRAIAQGTVGLNEFGTASGSFHLSAESAIGACALRLYLNGTARIIPAVFAIQYYRRPNFEVKLGNVPTDLAAYAGKKLNVSLSAKYYFGTPVATAKADVRLVKSDNWRPLASAQCTLSANGDGTAELELPESLAGGSYHFICAVTDDSNQTVTQTLAATITTPEAKPNPLSAVPRFLPAGTPLRITGVNGEISAEHDGLITRFSAGSDGAAELNLAGGWWKLSCGDERTTVFVYGAATPWDHGQPESDGFVNLARYGSEESGTPTELDVTKPSLWALLGKQHAEVGGTIPVLLYAPGATRAVLTMEGRTVLDYVSLPLSGKGPYYRVEVPIRARHVPNFYLQGCIVSNTPGELAEHELAQALDMAKKVELEDDSEDPKWCRIDVIDPNPQSGSEKLKLAVTCDAAQHRPGDDVSVSVRVTDLSGQPREAEVSLAAIDASIYAFGEDHSATLAETFSDPHPPRRFLPKSWKVSTGVSFNDTQRRQLQRAYETLAKAQDMRAMQKASAETGAPSAALDRTVVPLGTLGQMPVTQIPLVAWRTDFRETAAWLPQLRSDRNGQLTTHFTLPDSLTRYRITAVGLTKQTEIGTARTELESTLPLSVQVFLPRFAVEGDRLLATGLIHNNTGQEMSVPFAWEIQNATASASDDASLLLVPNENGTTVVPGRIKVEAHGTAHVSAWLTIDQLRSVSVGLRAGDGAAADAEKRVLPIIPNGRPLEVALTGAASGTIQLPVGFVPSDLRLSVSRSVPSEALQGLGYLVEYPYGCVEQTMSRFLPAVMVKHAFQQGVSELPQDVLKKLPDVLEKGLARLYNFQHEDGGWGWWEKDQTNDGMSVYVVYGLARCKSTGTAIDSGVLNRGCAYVRTRLADERLDRTLWARGWQALALAGAASAEELKGAAGKVDVKFSREAIASMALACRAAGLVPEATDLRARLSDWHATTTESLAQQLNVQTAFSELEAARVTGDALMAQRTGLRWYNTKDTSWAIEAMTGLVSKLPPLQPAREFAVSMAGKPLVEAKTPAELSQRVFDVHLTGSQIPPQEHATLELRANWPEPVHYALNATGYQRMDKLEPTGTTVQLTRQYLTTDGKPLAAPVKPGDCIAVHLHVKLQQNTPYLLVEDRRPAGFEFGADILHGGAAPRAANTEFRDDRVCVFFDALDAGDHEVVYYLRAETPGVSHVIPGCAYPMYDEKQRGETGADTLEIVQK